jgi:flagellar assembly protein FliH
MQTRPYDFGDLKAPAPAVTEPITVADIEAARESAFRDGYEAARAEMEGKDRETLAAIGDAVAAFRTEFEALAAAERTDLRAAAGEFCRAFATKLAETHEVEAALSLLDRVLDASIDRTHLTLSLSAKSARKWRERLIVAIRKRGAESFTSLESDADLAPGECRINWRGGAIARLIETSLKEIDAVFARETPSGAPKPSEA